MIDPLVQLSATSLALVPVAMAITQVIKMWVIDSRWAPITAIGAGVVLAFVVPQATIMLTVLQGILIGLTASGIYRGVEVTLRSPTP